MERLSTISQYLKKAICLRTGFYSFWLLYLLQDDSHIHLQCDIFWMEMLNHIIKSRIRINYIIKNLTVETSEK